MRKLLLMGIIAIHAISCTQDKFEQIDANFAYLTELNKVQDALLADLQKQIDANQGSITALEENLGTTIVNLTALEERSLTTEGDIIRINYAVDALESFRDDISDHIDTVDGLLSELQQADLDQANNLQIQLEEAKAVLAADQDAYTSYLAELLQGATDDLKALFDQAITDLEFDSSFTIEIDQSTTEVVSGTTTVETVTATPTVVNGVDGQDGAQGEQGIQGIQGEQGPQGERGESAYEIYVRVTTDDPVLTEVEWIDSLRGADGQDGEDGEDGTDGTNGLDGQDGADGANGIDGINGTNGMDGADGDDAVVSAELTAQIQSLTESLTIIGNTALSADSQVTGFLSQLDAIQTQLNNLESISATNSQVIDLQDQIDELTIDTDGDGVFDILDECATPLGDAIQASLGNGTISATGCYVAPLGSTTLSRVHNAGERILQVESTDNFEVGDIIRINNSQEYEITDIFNGQIQLNTSLAIQRQSGASVVEQQQ